MSFEQFLGEFVSCIQKKSRQVNQASWLLETTGSPDAAALRAELETELRLFFKDQDTFDKLKAWNKDASLKDPLLKRQLDILIRTFKPNLISKDLIELISHEEARLSLLYSNFRPVLWGHKLSENEIREILKTENNVQKRKDAWEASKQIGSVLAPWVLMLVNLRNDAAKSLGYRNYFSMQLDLQEVDEQWLFETFDQLSKDSEAAYINVLEQINQQAAKRFQVPEIEIGPWAWSDPFCQEDPIDTKELDELVRDVDILEVSKKYYQEMGFDVEKILQNSDNFERPGKNQHAFCIHMDREGDVRTLNNVKPTLRWLDTVLHELGHAVYEMEFPKDMPWLLKTPPHMFTTEAMALVAGRQAYRPSSLDILVGDSKQFLKEKAERSLNRKQLIFSRWVLVMTYFESELYDNPHQDLNALWWHLVEKHQKIKCSGSQSQHDWAAKYHLGLAPVYYYSYLLGELFASSLEEILVPFTTKKTGEILSKKLFSSGNSVNWNALVKQVTGLPLTSTAWLKQFATD